MAKKETPIEAFRRAWAKRMEAWANQPPAPFTLSERHVHDEKACFTDPETGVVDQPVVFADRPDLAVIVCRQGDRRQDGSVRNLSQKVVGAAR